MLTLSMNDDTIIVKGEVMTKTLYDPVLLAKALAGTVLDDDFASFAHSGPVAARVADWTSHELPRVVAWLHDVVEDSDVTLADIERDFGASVATAVDSLTRREGESYHDEYLARVLESPLAVLVKWADLADNTSRGPYPRPSLKARYEGSRELLRDYITASANIWADLEHPTTM